MVVKLFQQLIITTLYLAFLRKFTVNLFAVYPFKYKLFIKILSLSLNTMLIVLTNTAMTYAVMNFECHKLIAKVNK